MVKQIAHELKNFALYRSYANYFSVEGILDLETYYRKRAHEEYNHHEWLSDFLYEADFKFMYPAVEFNTERVTNYLDSFVQTVDREILTTQMLYAKDSMKEDLQATGVDTEEIKKMLAQL